MKRCDFLKSVSGLAAGAMVPAPAIWSLAKGDALGDAVDRLGRRPQQP